MQQGGVACKAEGDYVVVFLHSPPSASRHLHLACEGRSLNPLGRLNILAFNSSVAWEYFSQLNYSIQHFFRKKCSKNRAVVLAGRHLLCSQVAYSRHAALSSSTTNYSCYEFRL